jgi:hypothetical protein
VSQKEATLIGYRLLFDSKGNLVTERTSVDLKHLKKLFTQRDYEILRIALNEAKNRLDAIHNQIEAQLNNSKSL